MRCAGILLHPTSLPSRFGIGDLGPTADRFLDWARDAGASLWQVLPLGPTGGVHSPYNCLSAFAGNPLLISPEELHREGWLTASELEEIPAGEPDRVDFAAVEVWKPDLLRRAFRRFRNSAPAERQDELASFAAAPEQREWLDDWCLFAALDRRYRHRGWWEWPVELRRARTTALRRAREDEKDEIEYHRFVQWVFFGQWRRLRAAARERGLRILGDLPIYVARHSADVWAGRELFEVRPDGTPEAVAGCPPDYFSEDGQLWGNPLYRWDRMAADGYRWWIRRLEANLRLADQVRFDHFRGFVAYWRIPAGAATARDGAWVPGPGKALFDAFAKSCGDGLPLVAEDLGDLTDDVHELRRDVGLPGMRVLQFGFDEPGSAHAPHRLDADVVVYTGTHDNDTTVGWFAGLDTAGRRKVRRYTGARLRRIHWDLIRVAFTSPAATAIVPVQDLLGLGNEARMNLPGTVAGNWLWRLRPRALHRPLAERLRQMAEMSERLPPS